jgi:hypothetical protein
MANSDERLVSHVQRPPAPRDRVVIPIR